MDLHLHLSVAFRALDRKWGAPIDLDTAEYTLDNFPCLPAVVDLPTATFSSEEYLKSRSHRPSPYSRVELKRPKSNIKRMDSFSDISSSRLPSLSDLENVTSFKEYLDEFNEEYNVNKTDFKFVDEGVEADIPVKVPTNNLPILSNVITNSRNIGTGSMDSVDSGFGSKRDNIWKQLKENVALTLKRKRKRCKE